MSVASPEGGFAGAGVGDGEPEGLSSTTVAGATTFFVLVVSAICMWQGADAQRVLLTASLSMILFALINYSPAAGIAMTIGYLSMVGGLKRYIIPLLGYSSFDPLLLVAPFIVILFFMNRLIQRNIPRDTPLAKMVLALLIIMLLEVINPLQGGLTVGMAGALFYVIPLIWFYVGRSFGDKRARETVMNSLVITALLGAAYGIYQQFVGFSQIEIDWIKATNNDEGQFITHGVMRVFSFFSSFAEYTQFLGFGAIICFCTILRRNRIYVIPFILLMIAIVFSSSRGALLASVAGCSMVWAVQGRSFRSWVPRLVVAGIVGALALFYGLSSVKTASLDQTSSVLLTHQADGLLAPTDKKASTGGIHLQLIGMGIAHGFRNPLGSGLGVTTIAAKKLGEFQFGTEADYSNMFVSCGFIGGTLYLVIIGYVIFRMVRRWNLTRDLPSLEMYAILVFSIGFWLEGSHYASSTMIWFLIGGMDSDDARELAAAKRKRETVLLNQESKIARGRQPLSNPVNASSPRSSGQLGHGSR